MDHSALLEVGSRLKQDGYQFITPTPLTHRRVMARGRSGRPGLREIFGWNFEFTGQDLPQGYWRELQAGSLIAPSGRGWRSRVRYSSLGSMLLAHSAYPTIDARSVFFGPDTYRFVRAVRQVLAEEPDISPSHIVDIGSGSGAGGLFCASLLSSPARITLADVNDQALAFSRVNADLNGLQAESVHSDLLAQVRGTPDLIISNPPYLVDRNHRTYRDGGGAWGCDLAVRIVAESLRRLHRRGALLLYTGAPVVDGRDMFIDAVQGLLRESTTAYRYEEIDPDVFGEELEQSPYDRAERIATVMLFVKGRNIRNGEP